MTTLYRLYNDTDELLYVGISERWTRRLGQHRASKPWWAEVAKVHLETIPDRHCAERAEIAAIQVEKPRHNVVHVLRRKSAERTRVEARLRWKCLRCDSWIDPLSAGFLQSPTAEHFRFADEMASWESMHGRLDAPLSTDGTSGLRCLDLGAVMDLPDDIPFTVTCAACDEHGDDSYWWRLDRLATWPELLRCIAHLWGKKWVQDSNLDDVLYKVAAWNDDRATSTTDSHTRTAIE